MEYIRNICYHVSRLCNKNKKRGSPCNHKHDTQCMTPVWTLCLINTANVFGPECIISVSAKQEINQEKHILSERHIHLHVHLSTRNVNSLLHDVIFFGRMVKP